jgi:hypothetical protein
VCVCVCVWHFWLEMAPKIVILKFRSCTFCWCIYEKKRGCCVWVEWNVIYRNKFLFGCQFLWIYRVFFLRNSRKSPSIWFQTFPTYLFMLHLEARIFWYWNYIMTNLMHKFLIYFSIYFCLTCFGLSFSPSLEAGVQLRQWFKSPG